MAINKISKIYIAGHTGMIGSSILSKMRSTGYKNIITRAHNVLDLTSQKAVFDFFKKQRPEYVFLCAGMTGGIMANKSYPATFIHNHLSIQNNVFEAANRSGVKRLIFYGSSCAYPKESPQPIKEEYLLQGKLEETSEAYAAAKIAGILACRAYNKQYGGNRFIALTPNSVYGPGDKFDPEISHVLPALILKIHEAKTAGKDLVVLWGSGKPRREFIFSEDMASASIFAMANADKMNKTHYNVGTGCDYSIREIAGRIAALIGYEGEIRFDGTKPDGPMRKLLDSSAFNKLGWKTKIDLEKGLRITYQWFLDNHVETKLKNSSTKREKALSENLKII